MLKIVETWILGELDCFYKFGHSLNVSSLDFQGTVTALVDKRESDILPTCVVAEGLKPDAKRYVQKRC